ncbi:MAG: nitroreductase family deazaflavin-dependent oxidoreductase [Rhodoglobus sp.]
MNRTGRTLTAAISRSPVRHVLRVVVPPVDRFLFRSTGGRWKLSAPAMPSLMLFTTGAKSGIRRESPLICFPQSDGTWFIVGSNFGLEHHPAWTANLMANPDAEVHFQRKLRPVRATLLSQREADELWPALEGEWPNYRDYEKTAKRDIRVFRLVPTDGADDPA